MPEDYPEKRRFPRISSDNPVLVTKLGPETLERFARTRVVGLGGCMFVADASYGVGSAVEMLISVKGQVVRARARVAWESPTPDGKTEVGVEFLAIDDVDRRTLEQLFVTS